MVPWTILTIMCIAIVHADSKWHQHDKREIKSSICDPIQNNTNKVQCYCGGASQRTASADCYQNVPSVKQDDPSWEGFNVLQNVSKLTLTNTRGVALEYVPTNALQHTTGVRVLNIKYCNIAKIESYAFANLSRVTEMFLIDNQVRVLAPNAFAHLPSLIKVSLDKNYIAEINRDVFVDLPSLEKLYLTNNAITTIHDKAFIHLSYLKELEIDNNKIFSLNSETFSGLSHLERLELSNNNLEVIGDNTFIPLISLQYLNLAANNIQMLDGKAFYGLGYLQVLSLTNNKLSAIENEKVYEPLIHINSLSLQNNQIRVIKPEAIAPVLNKFYNTNAQINLEGNHLLCDCRLDVFKPFINKTLNERMKLEIQNLQCYPSEEVKQKWDKFQEVEKTSGQVFEDEELQENGAYEYYDETELNGTLFYFDVRHLLNCSGDKDISPVDIVSTTLTSETPETRKEVNDKPKKTASSPNVIIVSSTEPDTEKSTKVNNRGILDLATAELTTPESVLTDRKTHKPAEHNDIHHTNLGKDEKRKEKKDSIYTTSRLATVSAKPVEHKGYDDHDMASDEAKPDRIKAHRSIQEEEKPSHEGLTDNAYRHYITVPALVAMTLCIRVFL